MWKDGFFESCLFIYLFLYLLIFLFIYVLALLPPHVSVYLLYWLYTFWYICFFCVYACYLFLPVICFFHLCGTVTCKKTHMVYNGPLAAFSTDSIQFASQYKVNNTLQLWYASVNSIGKVTFSHVIFKKVHSTLLYLLYAPHMFHMNVIIRGFLLHYRNAHL